MTRYLSLLLIATSAMSFATAQVEKFPYQAKVVVDEVYVRSGGGEAFYPTQSLKKDAVVTVRRHDPGGWYMIDPPSESFSWIPEKYVRQTSAGAGEVTESNVVVFVGSTFGDETHVWQRKMMAGEKLMILERRQLDTLSGLKNMLKIKPPSREYRWIPGSALIPVGEQERSQHDRNPWVTPSNVVRRPVSPGPPADSNASASPTTADSSERFSPSIRLKRLKQVREEQRQLQEIDQKFRSMILSPPAQWNLESIEAAYRELQDKATYKPIAGQIDLRYPAINRYRQRKAALDDLNQLTSQTERRDAELLASQYGVTAGTGTANGQTTTVVGDAFAFAPIFGGAGGAGPATMATPVPKTESERLFTAGASPPAATSTGDMSRLPAIPASSRYIGAGYVRRGTGTDESEYLLTSPAGKVLAHLKSGDDIDLEQHLGTSVGVHGSRYFDDSIKSDRIEVSGLEPVRLR